MLLGAFGLFAVSCFVISSSSSFGVSASWFSGLSVSFSLTSYGSASAALGSFFFALGFGFAAPSAAAGWGTARRIGGVGGGGGQGGVRSRDGRIGGSPPMVGADGEI
jgi:hypothetical protein